MYIYKWINLHICIFILLELYQDKFLEVGLLEQRINARTVLVHITKFPPIGILPSFLPTKNVWKYLFPHSLANKACIFRLSGFSKSDRASWILRKWTQLHTLKIYNEKIEKHIQRSLERMGQQGWPNVFCIINT